MHPAQTELSKWPRRFWLTVAVIVGLMLCWFIVGKVKDRFTRIEVGKARAISEQTAEREMNERIASLKESGALIQQIASSKIDMCYIQSHDRGWMTDSYSQECYLKYVEAFTTGLTKEEVKKIQDANRPQIGGLLLKNPNSIIFRPADCPASGDTSWRPECETPGRFSLGDGDSRTRVIKDYKNFYATSTSSSENQIWITLLARYYSEDLGCAIPKILFCNNPRPRAIQAP